MNRRRLIAASAATPLAALPLAEGTAAKATDYVSFYVYPLTGYLAWEADAHIVRASTAHVVGYEPIGMPETYDSGEYVPVDPPVPMGAWMRDARFPRDNYGEPTFIRVYWEDGA